MQIIEKEEIGESDIAKLQAILMSIHSANYRISNDLEEDDYIAMTLLVKYLESHMMSLIIFGYQADNREIFDRLKKELIKNFNLFIDDTEKTFEANSKE